MFADVPAAEMGVCVMEISPRANEERAERLPIKTLAAPPWGPYEKVVAPEPKSILKIYPERDWSVWAVREAAAPFTPREIFHEVSFPSPRVGVKPICANVELPADETVTLKASRPAKESAVLSRIPKFRMTDWACVIPDNDRATVVAELSGVFAYWVPRWPEFDAPLPKFVDAM